MSQSTSTSRIQAKANSDHIEFGTAQIRVYSPREVLTKSLKTLGLFWGLALLSVLLPVVHFVSVPVLFGLGIYMTLRTRKLRKEIISGSIHCPHCRQAVEIRKAPLFDELTEICQNCASVVRISEVP